MKGYGYEKHFLRAPNKIKQASILQLGQERMKGGHLDSNYLVIETKITLCLSGNLRRNLASINKATVCRLFVCVGQQLDMR
jgi:hypothetical protein